VPQDTDSLMDVYERRSGDLELLSTCDGDIFGAYYKGNDRTGRNVYMVSQDSLSWQDLIRSLTLIDPEWVGVWRSP
jgi:hypothetical protein